MGEPLKWFKPQAHNLAPTKQITNHSPQSRSGGNVFQKSHSNPVAIRTANTT